MTVFMKFLSIAVAVCPISSSMAYFSITYDSTCQASVASHPFCWGGGETISLNLGVLKGWGHRLPVTFLMDTPGALGGTFGIGLYFLFSASYPCKIDTVPAE